MGKAIEELAHFVAGTPWEAIPEAVREHAKLVLLDTAGVILAGSVQREVAGVRARLTATVQVPRLKPARVTVTLKDGRRVTRLRESARGDYQDPYGEGEVRSKFRGLAGLVLSPAGVARLEAAVDRLDDLPRLGELVEPMREDHGP